MSLNLEFRPAPIRAGHATYRGAELALEYVTKPAPLVRTVQSEIEKAAGIRQPRWLVLADTLVITFSGPSAELVSFDAYTNIERWVEASEMTRPAIVGGASARLLNPPHDSDRIDLEIVPQFRYSPTQHRLRIDLGGRASQHHQLATCLFAGVDGEKLTSLVLSGLRVK